MYLLAIFGILPLLAFFKKEGWHSPELLLLTLSILLFEPLVMSILKGQDSALLLLGGTLWLTGFLRRDDRLAGLGLSLTLIRPHLALFMAIPFLLQGRKIWWWFCAGVMALGLYSFLLLGITGTSQYLHILILSSAGGGYGISQEAMVNLTGLLIRMFPGLSLDLLHLVGWSFYGLALVSLCLVWRFSHQLNPAHLALSVCMALFSAPHLHYHDLALLVVPLLCLVVIVAQSSRTGRTWIAALLLFTSIFLVPGELWTPAGHCMIYLLFFLLPCLAFLVLRPKKNLAPPLPA